MTAQVLVVTNAEDLGADLVMVELSRREVPTLRCNTEELARWSVELQPGEAWRLEDPRGRNASSEEVLGVWWRRPERPSKRLRLPTPGEATALDEQWYALLEGLASVPGPFWVSRPAFVRRSEDKAFQLAVARGIGFPIPRTLWTNRLDAAHSFLAREGGGGVLKTATAAHWESDAEAGFVFAQRLSPPDLPAEVGDFRPVPSALQQRIEPKQDIRVTVAGDRVLAAVTSAEQNEALDWRLEPDRGWSRYALPIEDRDRCRRLVGELGLAFGAIDLVRDGEGLHWFLEINPNGEWGWLQQAAGLRIAEALADTLSAPR